MRSPVRIPSYRRHTGTMPLSNRARRLEWSRAKLLYRFTAGLRYRYPADLGQEAARLASAHRIWPVRLFPKDQPHQPLCASCASLHGRTRQQRASRVWFSNSAALVSHVCISSTSGCIDLSVRYCQHACSSPISWPRSLFHSLAAIMPTNVAESDGANRCFLGLLYP